MELKPLNVLIGPNGSGKSNLIEMFKVLQAIPFNVHEAFKTGGSQEWIHKGESDNKTPKIEIEYDLPLSGGLLEGSGQLRYIISFRPHHPHMMVKEERLEEQKPKTGYKSPYFFLDVEDGSGVVNPKGQGERRLTHETFKSEQSVLSQISDPDQFPEITQTANFFKNIFIYQNWTFGMDNPLRFPQGTADPSYYLSPTFDNLGLVLSRLRQNIKTKNLILEKIRKIYDGITDVDFLLESTRVQVNLHEKNFSISSMRLSDGTLRWIALLVIFCHPSPPPVICLEEPELGLHPDLIVDLAELLKGASKNSTLIITTHSEILIDALTDTPEYVVVCEKENGCTNFNRLSKESLGVWLKDYTLGKLWMNGQIGGNRW